MISSAGSVKQLIAQFCKWVRCDVHRIIDMIDRMWMKAEFLHRDIIARTITVLTFCLLADIQEVVAKPLCDTEEEPHSNLTSVAGQDLYFLLLKYCRTALICNILVAEWSYYSLDLLNSSSSRRTRLLHPAYYRELERPSLHLE